MEGKFLIQSPPTFLSGFKCRLSTLLAQAALVAKRTSRWFGLLGVLTVALRATAAGTWVPLANPPPGPAGHFLLLTDGTVMAEDLSTDYGPGWFRLTPDIHGSYVNGSWSTLAPMHATRLDFSSVVLPDGRVFVAGGEYGTGTNSAEVYDPASNTWELVPSPPAGQDAFYDSGAVVLANGNVLIAPVYPATSGGTVIYNPALHTLSAGPTLFRGYNQDEASWVKLADDSILTIDPFGVNSERYLPVANTWVNDANVPVSLYDPFGGELGPALLLANGKAIFFGSTGHTALYTPSGSSSPGNWAAGPDFPNGQGMPDAPAAVMVNGKILCATSPTPTTSNHYPSPTSFFEYDYLSNSFTQVNAPGGGTTFAGATWPTLMLDLPDGSVLFGHRSTDFYVYQPAGAPLAAGKPAIASITVNPDGSLHLIGTLFNGLSQGAAYGDDEQMDSNFPIVRFTNASGNIRYGRTSHWSRTSVMTGSAAVSTDCTLPAGASLTDAVQVIANGSASDRYMLAASVYNTADSGPGSLRNAILNSVPGALIIFATNLSAQRILLTSGELPLTNGLTLDASALPGGIVIDGNHSSRVFAVAGGVTVVLNSLTLSNGYAGTGNWGGAIVNSGTLTLNNCTLAGNLVDASGAGGAIENDGPLTLAGCTFSGNAAGFAGAIDNRSTCTARNCTFFGNAASAANGGAIDNAFSASLNLLHCTFSGNTAAGVGAGIDNYLSQVNLTNTIVALNPGQDIYNWSGSSTVAAGGSNIVQSLVSSATVIGAGSILAVDPRLGPLASNGGPTQTMLPLPGSPAIDGGNDAITAAAGLTADQRGLPRPAGLHVDIGAVEMQIPVATSPILLMGVSVSGDRSFDFSFTNRSGVSFRVLASTNLSLSLTNWTMLGSANETPAGSGMFHFTDPQATNYPARYYRVRSP